MAYLCPNEKEIPVIRIYPVNSAGFMLVRSMSQSWQKCSFQNSSCTKFRFFVSIGEVKKIN